jgi:polysaccharide pyruvyl transferase CsaB
MKILLAAMSMGLGGAETHVLELARGLSERGHRVFVSSAGGVYAKELSAYGVTHVEIPLNAKDPGSVAASFSTLSKLMEKERFDIVHAHARIPAFICGKLQKRFGYAFITTVHFDFRCTPLLKRITDWGEHLIAVSEDLALSVEGKYGYPRENMTVVNNGVDTVRFSPENSGLEVREKLGLTGEKTVMYLGRLDSDSYLPAQTLIEAAEEIYEKSGTVTVIVGCGEKQASLEKQAADVNERLDRKVVILAGGTSDAAGYIAACDVFVGPSRSAMEALASGKPTVLAGTFGMLGVFSRDTEAEALRTNLCCRGSEIPTAEKVAHEVCRLLSLDEKSRNELSLYGREFVKTHYSAAAMVCGCEKAYLRLLEKRKKTVTLCGYYGYGNIGDELMLRALLDRLDRCDGVGRVFVMSADNDIPKSKKAQTVPRFDIARVENALASSHAIVFGGGNILQDKTSTKSLIYYTQVLSLARKRGCKAALCSNGIGPILSEKNMERVRKALLLADYISMREEDSARLAKKLTGREDIIRTADIAFAAPLVEGKLPALLEKKDFYLVFPKANAGCDTATLVKFCCKMKREHGLIPIFTAMHKRQDAPLCREFAARLPWAYYFSEADEAQIRAMLASARFALAMRLHGAVMAASQACPVIATSDDGKVREFFEESSMPCYAFLEPESSAEQMYSSARKALEQRAEFSAQLAEISLENISSAKEELDRLCAFLTEF